MGRKLTNTVEYFYHDAHAATGDTLTILQSRYGNNGYAVWFKILEKLCHTEGHFIDIRNTVKWQLFLVYLCTDEITTVEIIDLLVEMQAIDKTLWKSRIIWCENLVNHLSLVYANRKRNLPRKPSITEINAITTVENELASVESTQREGRGGKEVNIIINNNIANNGHKDIYGEFQNVLLKKDEYTKLTERYGEKRALTLIETLSTGKESKGYKYKSDYAAILNWAKREDKEKPVERKSRFNDGW